MVTKVTLGTQEGGTILLSEPDFFIWGKLIDYCVQKDMFTINPAAHLSSG